MGGASIRRHGGREGLRPEAFRRPVVTLGVFDGMHRGHRHVVEHLRSLADQARGEAVVVTFATHPKAILEGRAPPVLLSTEHRILLLDRLGVDAVVVLPFDDAMRRTPWETFLRDVLVEGIGLHTLLLGFDSGFGYRGLGTVERVAPVAAELGFDLREAPPISEGGEPISSTRIRAAVEAGDLEEAARMLGRPLVRYGRVVRGDGRGRQIGFPTANVDPEGELLPPVGVYQVIVGLGEERRVAVANIGLRPTFDGGDAGVPPQPLLEVHIPDFEADLYGQRIEVEFVRKLRDERRFASVDALVDQIRKDVASLGT